jgi:tetratricopeptide (TPR) repeat protein
VLWGVILAIALLYRGELGWAAGRLNAYWTRGDFPALHEHALRNEALALIQGNGDLARARELLERSLTIDPNTDALALLGEVHLRTGDTEGALELYSRFNRIDPSSVGGWIGMANAHARAGREQERQEILQRGIETLTRLAEDARPVRDPTVDERFNRKAVEAHERLLGGVALLRNAHRAGPPR